jgi:hypothetical protein
VDHVSHDPLSGMLLASPTISGPDQKGFPVTSTLAYFASLPVRKKNDFINLTPGVNVIKRFPSLLMTRPNKLECFYLAITFQCSLTFAGNTRSLPKKERKHLKGAAIELALALPANSKT